MATLDSIKDVNGFLIDPEWASEFRGFFWGEGMLTMQKWSKRRAFAVYCRITLRDDDRLVLYKLQNHLGGTIRRIGKPGGGSKPVCQWQVSKLKECQRIYEILSSSKTDLPFKKKRELLLWGEALEIKSFQGWMPPAMEDRQGQICKELQALKQYSNL